MKNYSLRQIERVAPRQQQNWDWRAATNFMLGGIGGGLVFASALAQVFAGGDARLGMLLGLALVGGGLTAVWFEIGRPWRALNVFLHPATSWMTREAIAAALLFACGLAALLTRSNALVVVAALLALVFVYCQARILTANKGIPAWRQPRLQPLMLVTGLAEGAAVLALLTVLAGGATLLPVVLFCVLLVARIAAWKSYLATLRATGAPQGSLRVLAEIDPRLVLIGHVAPLGLAIAAAIVPGLALPAIVLAALAVAGSGLWLKYVLVRRAAFNQGMALPHLPRRGSGSAAAGTQPGWNSAG